MGVYKNSANNTWYFRTTYKDFTGKTKYVTRRGFRTKAEAKRAEAQFSLEYKECLKNTNIRTFEELYNEYYEYQQLRVKESTLITVDNKIKLHVLPYFKNRKLMELSTANISDWQDHMLKQGYSINYLQGIHSKFSSVLQYGVKMGYLKYNVVEMQGNFKRSTKDIKEMDFYTFEEWQRFEEHLEDDEYKVLFQFLYYTGARVGEALALTFNDFDSNFTKVNINKTITAKTKEVGYAVTTTKTYSSVRTISIPDILSISLKKYFKKVSKYVGFTKKDFVFGITKPLSTTTIDRKKKKASESAGVKCIRIHDFRHSHASFLINNGVEPMVISKRLGHSSLSTTLDVYVHMFREQDEKSIKVINESIDKANIKFQGAVN